jgi:tetratricopeptide (TPR) repeat protein
LLGRVLLEQKKSQDAAAEFKKALELNPEESNARLGLAQAHIELKEWAPAQTLVDEALQKNANDADAYYLRGLLAAASRGDHQAAAADFEKALQINPSLAYAHYHAGLVYSRLRRPDLMARHFEAFLSLSPNAPEAPKVRQVLATFR